MTNNTIYVVGGGPSLIGFDWGLLKNKKVIAVNRAFEKLPNAYFIYFSDIRFWGWFGEAMTEHKAHIITTAKLNPRPKGVIFYKRSSLRKKALDNTPGYLKLGNNSGYAAINLAVQFGATKIALLGFDMCNTNSKTHWHNGYIVKNSDDVYEKSMLKYYAPLATELSELGIDVTNYGSTSKLDVFTKKSLESVYDL